MTQCRLLLTLWLASMLLATPASANEQYNQGSEFAKGHQRPGAGGHRWLLTQQGAAQLHQRTAWVRLLRGRHQRLHRPHLTR